MQSNDISKIVPHDRNTLGAILDPREPDFYHIVQ